MARQLTQAALAAKEIRKTLKAHNIPAKVRSSNFSMGSSVDVEVTDLAPWTVKAIREALDKYEYGTFDGMTDCQGTKNRDFDGPQTKYLSVNNHPSDETRQKIWDMLKDDYAAFVLAGERYDSNFLDADGNYASNTVHQVFTGYRETNFWQKPRVKAA